MIQIGVTYAMIVLPLNSAMNPLLYDDALRTFFSKIVQSLGVKCSNGVRYLRALREVDEEISPMAVPTDGVITETSI